jgi:hypothetical protein
MTVVSQAVGLNMTALVLRQLFKEVLPLFEKESIGEDPNFDSYGFLGMGYMPTPYNLEIILNVYKVVLTITI